MKIVILRRKYKLDLEIFEHGFPDTNFKYNNYEIFKFKIIKRKFNKTNKPDNILMND